MIEPRYTSSTFVVVATYRIDKLKTLIISSGTSHSKSSRFPSLRQVLVEVMVAQRLWNCSSCQTFPDHHCIPFPDPVDCTLHCTHIRPGGGIEQS